MRMFSKLKARYLWIIFAVMVCLCALVVFLCTKIDNKKLTMALLIVVFLLTSFIFQAAISKSMVYKSKKKLYNPKNVTFIGFEEAKKNLLQNKFEMQDYSFGMSFAKIEDRVAYKVLFVNNIDNYYSPTSKDQNKPGTKNIDKCLKMISIEIFFSTNDTLMERIGEFSIETDKLLFKAYYNNNTLIDPNKIEISDKFNKEFNKFIDIIGITYEDKEDSNI